MKLKLISALSALAVGGGCLVAIPAILNNTNNVSTQKADNNKTIVTDNIKHSSNVQVVKAVDQIVVESVNSVNFDALAAIVNNNGKQEIYVWGSNGVGQLGLGDTKNYLIPTLLPSTSLGDYSSIKSLNISNVNTVTAVVNTINGEQIYVWGNNTNGQLGLGNTTNQSSPVLFDTTQFGDLRIKEISFAYALFGTAPSSYAILSPSSGIGDDKIYVWGDNGAGQLGLGDKTIRTTPTLFDTTQFGAYKNIREFNVNSTSYAIVETINNAEKLFMWGSNAYGQCGIGNTAELLVPKELSSSIFNNAKIKNFYAVYISSFLVLTRNGVDELYTWGYNGNGQIGNGTTTSQLTPFRIPQANIGNASEILNVSSFDSVSILVKVNQELKIYVWGYNFQGQLGLGDNTNRLTPVELPKSRLGNFTEFYDWSFDNFKYGFQYSRFAYVKTPGGDALYIWGLNDYGQLGLGNTSNFNTPTQVNYLNLSTAKIKNFGKNMRNNFMLILDRNGQSESYTAGYNQNGQLGTGNTTNALSFTQILPTRYTNPRSKVIPTTNLTSSQALELINPNNTLNRIELDKYVDTTSFPAGATLSIDPATTTSDYKNGILNLGIRTNQYNVPMVLATQIGQKTFNVTIPGFRPVTDVNTNPVSVIIRDAAGNNIDKIYDQLVDSTYKVINRDLLEYYFDLSSIPPNAVIHLYRTSFGNDTEATFTLTSSQVYGNNGLIVSNQLYVKTDLVWTFTSSQLNLALVISLSVVGGLLLIGAIIAIMLVRRSSNRLII